MGTFSIWHWLIVLAVVLVLFGGGGKIPKLMRDMGQGINAFKRGLKEDGKKDKDLADSDQESIEQTTAAASVATEKQDTKAAKG